jgi:flagellar hook-associated protein 3 FlgL
MTLRVSTSSTFSRVLLGIRSNQIDLIKAQEQVASGLRLLRPSDDPTGTAKALSLTRQIADVNRFNSAINSGITLVDTATAGLQDAATLLAEARQLLVQGMNGTQTMEDRESLAVEFDLLRAQIMEVGNLRAGDRYLFGGTDTTRPPWVEESADGTKRVLYRGNEESQYTRVGESVDVPINLPGIDVFGRLKPTGTTFAGLTGVSNGLTADEGMGYEYLHFRHDSTLAGGIAGVGLALVGGGDDDTILGANALSIDVAAGTVQLGSGPVTMLPDPASAGAADFVVKNELGAELHLNFTGFTGADYAGTVTGQGSVSLHGSDWTPVDFTETDLELSDPNTGAVLHINTTGVKRAGEELVTFGGSVNLFDVLQGVADDLRNVTDLEPAAIVDRLEERLSELDRGHENLLLGMGVLGSRSQRLKGASERMLGIELQLESLRSSITDADYAEVALDLARSDLNLQVAQASGARLIQTSLLKFLG